MDWVKFLPGKEVYLRVFKAAQCHVYTHPSACNGIVVYIKTHDSESRGQEEAGRMRRMSVLFTGNTTVKFVNALNKPPLKLSLSYQRLSTF